MSTIKMYKGTREQWYMLAHDYIINDLFMPELGIAKKDLAPVRISTGFPSGSRPTEGRFNAGCCHPRSHSTDGHNEIFISPQLVSSMDILETLVHEEVHAQDDCQSGHKGAFKRMATTIGLTGKMTETSANDELKEFLQDFIDDIGHAPFAPMDIGKRKKQGTRMIKIVCDHCGFTARTTKKWTEQMNSNAQCPCCGNPDLNPEQTPENNQKDIPLMNTKSRKTFKQLTFKEKKQIRAHMRAAGKDPMEDYTVAQFVDYGYRFNFITDEPEVTPQDVPTKHDATPEDDAAPDDDAADDEHMMPADDVPTDAELIEETNPADDDQDADDQDADDQDADDQDADDQDADDQDADDQDDEQETPPPPPAPEATNPMEQMIDDRVKEWLAHHTQADQHSLTTIETAKALESLKRAVDAMPDALPLAPTAPVITVDRERRHTEVKVEGVLHKQFNKVKTLIEIGLNVYLKGEAGSGKTHMAKQLADVFGLDFYMDGRVDDIFTLTGFTAPDKTYMETNFYKAFKHGGLYLADEMDRWSTEALTGINAATSNGWCSFPDGLGVTKKHKDFIMVAAGNTWGTGHDRVYTAAQALDGSSMNRYTGGKIEIEYDEDLERAVALAHNSAAGKWVDYVQQARANAAKAKLDLIISPRDSINGAISLAGGFTVKEVKEMSLYAGQPKDVIAILDRS